MTLLSTNERDRRGEKPKPPSAEQPLSPARCSVRHDLDAGNSHYSLSTQLAVSYSLSQRGTAAGGSRLMAEPDRNNDGEGTIRRRERRHTRSASWRPSKPLRLNDW